MAGGFCKPGSNNYSQSKHWRTTLEDLSVDDKAGTAILELSFEEEAHEKYGAPKKMFLNVTAVGTRVVELCLTWINKTATMIGESLMMTFR